MIDLLDLSIVQLVLVGLVMLFAGFIHGTLGLGFPLMATPLLALFLDLRTAILITLLPTAVVNTASILHGGRWTDSLRKYWVLATCSLFGSAVGAFMIAHNDPAVFQLLLAALIFVFLLSPKLLPQGVGILSADQRWVMPLVGLVAGFAAGTTNVMVPVLIIYSLSLSMNKNTTVQVFNLCFLSGKLAQMAIFWWSGSIDIQFLGSTIPYAILGFVALHYGTRIRDNLPTETFRIYIRRLLFCFGVLLILRFYI